MIRSNQKSTNFILHESYCLQNIVTCPVCLEAVYGADMTMHTDMISRIIPCEDCKKNGSTSYE